VDRVDGSPFQRFLDPRTGIHVVTTIGIHGAVASADRPKANGQTADPHR